MLSVIVQQSLLLLPFLLLFINLSQASGEDGWRNAFHMAGIEGSKIPLTIYQSERSRLRVAVADVPGPLLRVRFNIVTEAKTNDGLPHTLEHLIFQGSHNYPYKGFLDKIAYKCMADGTNGFTFQDHNAYDLQTLGQAGFLKAVPVFMDHLLGPMLSESQFLTEVFHIDGKGNEGGVVYCEMQGHEQNMYSLVDKKLRTLFYGPKSSFATDCSGELTNLRSTCTLDKIRKFHEENYHLDNMLIFVTGKIDHRALLDAIAVAEEKFLHQIPQHFARPFSTEQSKLKISDVGRSGRNGKKKNKNGIVETLRCPSSDQANAMVQIAWPGPEWADQRLKLALQMLAISNTSSLERQMCNLAHEPLCSGVQISLVSRKAYEIRAVFYGVPVNKVDKIEERMFEILANKASNSALFALFNLDTMHSLLRLTMRTIDSALEADAHAMLSDILLAHQAYGTRKEGDNNDEYDYEGELRMVLNRKKMAKELLDKSAYFWTMLLRQYFVENYYVCVRGVPSKLLVLIRSDKEKFRLKKANLQMDEAGRLLRQQALENAIAEHKRNQPPKELVDSFLVKEYDGFDIIRVHSYRSDEQQKEAKVALPTNIPFLSYLHEIESEFVELVLIFNVEHQLTDEEHHWLRLIMELTFHSPAMDTLPYGQKILINIDQIGNMHMEELTKFQLELGVGNHLLGTGRLWSATVRTEAAQVHRMPAWMRLYLADTVYELDNALTCLNRLISNAEMSRDDPKIIADFMHERIMNGKESRYYGTKVDLALEKFHRHIRAKLESGNEVDTEWVLGRLNAVREKLLRSPVNLHFIGRADVLAEHKKVLDNPESWNFLTGHTTEPVHHIKVNSNNNDESNTKNKEETATAFIINGLGETNAVEVGGSESAYLVATAQLLLDGDCYRRTWMHPATMALMLLCAYMEQQEGPLWNAVRATGLAYGVQLSAKPDTGLISLYLLNCAKLGEAYEATQRAVLKILDENVLDESLFESAKRSLLSQMITSFQGSNPVDAGWAAMLNTIRELSPNFFYEQFGRQLWTASMEEVLALGAPALRRLFQVETSLRSIGFHPSRKADLEQAFVGIQFREIQEFQVETMPTADAVMKREEGRGENIEREKK